MESNDSLPRRHHDHSYLTAAILWIFLCASILTTGNNEAMAFETTGEDAERFEIGILGGTGTGRIVEGRFKHIMSILHLGYTIKTFPQQDSGRSAKLSLILEPQYNSIVKPTGDYEFGLGIGLMYRQPITDKLYAHVYICTGPHYISIESGDQDDGFVFSNHAGLGLYYFFTKNTAVNISYRYRHMSNGGTRHPNLGIDSHLGLIGVSMFFDGH